MGALISVIWSLLIKPRNCVRRNLQNNPLPEVCHLCIEERHIAGQQVCVVGDVHGCIDELSELIAEAEKKAGHGKVVFVFVGDLVNRGPSSVGVVRKLRAMSSRVYAVRGNHDESAIREARKFREDNNYILSEKYFWVKYIENEDFAFLNSLPYTISLPSLNALVVHAGLIPGVDLENQILNDMTNMRNIVHQDDPFFPVPVLKGTNSHGQGDPWVSLWPGPQHVYFGHDARRGMQRARYATGLDTGCCHGGALTGVFISGPCSGEFITIPSKQPRAHA